MERDNKKKAALCLTLTITMGQSSCKDFSMVNGKKLNDPFKN